MPELSTSLSQPAWVSKRDGRVVPFEPEKISRTLFAATESLGRPNALLARELTDLSLEILFAEIGSNVPTTSQVAELVAKVVRDVGQTALAQKYADRARKRQPPSEGRAKHEGAARESTFQNPIASVLGSNTADIDVRWLPWEAGRACLREHALREVFAPDLVAAHADGLLTLTGLETPLEMAAAVLGPLQPGERGLVEGIERTRQLVGEIVAIDGPEYGLAFTSGAHDDARADYARELMIGLRGTGLRAVVNVNSDTPPSGSSDWNEGPLFDRPMHPTRPEPLAEHADGVVEQVFRAGLGCRARIDWHLSERDFSDDGGARRSRLIRRALDQSDIAFVFDRPNRPIPLAEGLDRKHPSVLLSVGLHLRRLLEESGSGRDVSRFIRKVESLTRLALSAGLQKREFLRRHRPSAVADRRFTHARMVVVPLGLESVVRNLAGSSLCDGGSGLALGQQIISRLNEVLIEEGKANDLMSCMDSHDCIAIDETGDDRAAGLTAWDADADFRRQVDASGTLHAAAGAGTAVVLVSRSRFLGAEEAEDLLRYVWRHSTIIRLRLMPSDPPSRQMTAPWEASL